MKQSELFLKTQKLSPKDEESKNAKLLLRGGFIDKLMAGSYTFLPLGLRVLKNIEQIVREEMNKLGAEETRMPLLHPKNIWEETGRWESAEEVMFRVEKGGKEYGLSFTHEEVVMDILRKQNISYKNLPIGLYQFSNKFRNEPRSRSGLLRGVEFSMKDLYSVHTTKEDMQNYYNTVTGAYRAIFERIGLPIKVVEAPGGVFTSQNTHEFQVIAKTGEDTIYWCDGCDWAQNKEIATVKEGETCAECKKGTIHKDNAIEVGNTFPLGTHYSEKMGATFMNEDGDQKPFWFASYGIGTSRIVGTLVEISHDENGIIWPESVAPFGLHIVNLSKETDKAEAFYENLHHAGIDVLFDDRKNVSAGEKLAEADLLGIPIRAVISEKTLEKKSVELKRRDEDQTDLMTFDAAIKILVDDNK